MNLFKSPLRRKIESRIEELLKRRTDNVIERNGKTHLSSEYSKLLLEDSDNAKMIKELQNLLK